MAQECLTAIAFKNCARRIAGLIEYVGAGWILTRLRDFESMTKFFQTGLNCRNLAWRAAACRFLDRLNRRRAEACLVAGLKQLLLDELLGESHGTRGWSTTNNHEDGGARKGIDPAMILLTATTVVR
jgi:hypothetical protein